MDSSAPAIQDNLVLDNRGGGILLETGSYPAISLNQLWGNGGYAVYMDATCYPSFTGNTAFYNVNNGVRTAGPQTYNLTWDANLVYVVEGAYTINAGAALTLQPGTVVKFKDTSANLVVNGALIANGTSSQNIYFSSLRDDSIGGDTGNDDGISWPLAGDWGGITYNDSSNDAQDVLNYVQVRYAGSGGVGIDINSAAPSISNSIVYQAQGTGIDISTAANPQLTNNSILECTQDGIDITDSSSPNLSNNFFTHNGRYAVYFTAESKVTFSNNTATDNAYNGAAVTGTFNGSTTWMPDLTYFVMTTLNLPEGSDLTIQPGVIVKFLPGQGLTINGQLVADGTPASTDTPQVPIIFTSIKDDTYGSDTNNDGNASTPSPNDWGTIDFGTTSINSSITNASIFYGGSAVVKIDQTAVTVNQDRFINNQGGIDLTTANQISEPLDSNFFKNNLSYSINSNFANYMAVKFE